MPGLGIKIYTDEDVDINLALQLRRQGHDALSTQEAGRHNQKITDESQLQYAAQLGRAIVVHNADDYWILDAEWKAAGREHHGIIVTRRVQLGTLLRRIERHPNSVSPIYQRNILLHLAHD